MLLNLCDRTRTSDLSIGMIIVEGNLQYLKHRDTCSIKTSITPAIFKMKRNKASDQDGIVKEMVSALGDGISYNTISTWDSRKAGRARQWDTCILVNFLGTGSLPVDGEQLQRIQIRRKEGICFIYFEYSKIILKIADLCWSTVGNNNLNNAI